MRPSVVCIFGVVCLFASSQGPQKGGGEGRKFHRLCLASLDPLGLVLQGTAAAAVAAAEGDARLKYVPSTISYQLQTSYSRLNSSE